MKVDYLASLNFLLYIVSVMISSRLYRYKSC